MRHTKTTAPITIKKSPTKPFPFSEQNEYVQGYPDSHKDQAVKDRRWSFGTQHHIKRRQSDKQRCDLPDRFLNTLEYLLRPRIEGHALQVFENSVPGLDTEMWPIFSTS